MGFAGLALSPSKQSAHGGKSGSIMNSVFFELCIESMDAAAAAVAGGADRIELCSELHCGGITPASELTAVDFRSLAIPVHVLIRPRGGDFVYSAEEFELMRGQVAQAKRAGAGGVALGVLLRDGRVDVERTRALVELARPMDVTFHRAFDETRDLGEALDDVIATGAESLLTSGGAADVLTGAKLIGMLRHQAAGRIRIIAGGGLRLESLVEVVRRAGVYSLHGSLSRRNGSASAAHNGHALEDDVREAVRLLNGEYRSALAPAFNG
jgi:copper homeostasis protein